MKSIIQNTCFGLGLLILCTAQIGAQDLSQPPVKPVNIILDSDMAHNSDDVGDHAVLWAMAARGEVNVLALIISSTNDYSAATAQAVASYYGHPQVLIGANQTNIPNSYPGYFSYYTQQISDRFGFPGKTRNYYPDAVTVYRRALAGAADNSVYIVAGGFYRPLEDLLQSGPDAISPLSGRQLIIRKVKRLIPVGGRFPDSADTDFGNLRNDPDSASYVIANWPTEIVWVPDDQVNDIITGPASNADPNTNPVKAAYDLYCNNGAFCPSTTPAWTQAALLFAVRGGVGTNFGIGGQNGTSTVWDGSRSIPGRSFWQPSPNRLHAYLLKTIPSGDMAAIINPLLQWIPPRGPITQPPVATSQSVATAGLPLSVTLNATDPQGAALAYTIATQPSHGTLSGTAPNLTYTPTAGYIGPDSFTFWAANQYYQSNIATISITVNRLNHTPVANAQSVTSGGTSINIVLTATDADGDPLTYTVTTNPKQGTLSGVAPNLIYTPNAGYDGTDTVVFKANDGQADSNLATVTITVNTLLPPYRLRLNAGGPSITDAVGNVWQPDDGYTTGYTYPYSTTASIAVSGGDTRIYQTERYSGSTVGYRFSNIPNGTYTVNLYFAEISSSCFVPNCRVFDVIVQGSTFLHNLDVYATAGGGNIGIARSTTAIVNSGTLTLTLQGTLTGYPTISGIDLVRQSANSATLGSITGTVTQSGTGTPIVGAAVTYGSEMAITDSTGRYLFTHVTPGSYSLTVSSRGFQTVIQNAVVVAGATSPANFILSGGITQPPVATSQSVTTSGVPIPIILGGSDPQGAALTYTVATQPLHGTLSGTAPNLTYTPSSAYTGPDSFTFFVANQLYQSNVATVSITVTRLNHAPVANAQSVTSDGTPTTVVLTATDADGDPLTYTVRTSPTHGTLAGVAPNLTYTPASGYNGTDTLTFTANDGIVDSNAATITITVNNSLPPYRLRLNAGGPSVTDASGNVWQPDDAYVTGYSYAYSTTASIATSAGNARLYQSERYASSTVQYTFPNLPNGTYTVNLYFAEISPSCFVANCRVFDVVVQGVTFLRNFDVFTAAGGGNIGIARSTTAVVNNGTLTLALQATLAPYPTISAIDLVRQTVNSSTFGSITGTVTQSGIGTPIVGAAVAYGSEMAITDNNGQYLFSRVSPGPYTLTVSGRGYQNGSQTVVVTAGATTTANVALALTGSSGPFALRVNAGGPSITDTNGNVWLADTGYTGGNTYSTTSPITAAAGDTRIFATEHYTSGPLQYSFSGLPNGTYSVKLYFAEIAPSCFQVGCRVFNVVVQGTTVWPNFDVFAAAGGGNIGIVRQTTATVSSGVLNVLLQAPYSQYPTISGIELIKQ